MTTFFKAEAVTALIAVNKVIRAATVQSREVAAVAATAPVSTAVTKAIRAATAPIPRIPMLVPSAPAAETAALAPPMEASGAAISLTAEDSGAASVPAEVAYIFVVAF